MDPAGIARLYGEDGAAATVCIVTLGCAKNEVDSDMMRRTLAGAGYVLGDDPACADAIIVNTCSFITAATEESLGVIFDMLGLDRVACGQAKVVVAGCLPARYGDELAESLSEVETFVPCSKEDDIAAVLDALFPGRARVASEAAAGSPSAYVKISDGCDRFCSFCAIPHIRGRYRSFPFDEIEAEASRRIALGARELVLIAQDTGRWGSDFDEPETLAGLVERLATLHPDTWVRVMYLQPEGVTDELLDVMRRLPNVCSYLDIPFQHANARILRAMNRTGDGAAYLALVEHVRALVPDVTLRTTLIAGFPGETDGDFDELCAFVEDAELDYVGVFAYSQEDGTRAAKLDGQIDEDVKLERAQALRDVADAISHERIAARAGRTFEVLVLGREEDGQLYGRAQCQAPEVDGVVYLQGAEPGCFAPVTITDTLLYEMEGDVA